MGCPAGLCQAAVQALRKGTSHVRGRLLYMLGMFFTAFTGNLYSRAMQVLVEGGVAELAVWHMAEGPAETGHGEMAFLLILPGTWLGRGCACRDWWIPS
jgi:hypothetical protein